jgi:hypothetical protein
VDYAAHRPSIKRRTLHLKRQTGKRLTTEPKHTEREVVTSNTIAILVQSISVPSREAGRCRGVPKDQDRRSDERSAPVSLGLAVKVVTRRAHAAPEATVG